MKAYIYGAMAAILIGTTGLAWHTGRELRDERAVTVKLNLKVQACQTQLTAAEKATQDWSIKYEDDMKAKDNEYADIAKQQSDSAKAANRKQFDAGLRYGRAMCSNPPKPDGVRGIPAKGEDFAVFIDGSSD